MSQKGAYFCGFEQGLPPELGYLDRQKMGAYHELSSEIAHTGKYSLKQVIQGIGTWHHLASTFKFPYVDLDEFIAEVWFYIPDITKFCAVEMGIQKFTGEFLSEVGWQYGRDWLKDGKHKIWRMGPEPTKSGRGEWFYIDAPEHILLSQKWNRVVLKAKMKGLSEREPVYRSLQVNERSWNLGKYKVGTYPEDNPMNKWKASIRVILASTTIANEDKTAYFDDLKLAVPQPRPNMLPLMMFDITEKMIV